MDDRVGVGIIGAGAVVRAVHIPTLARLNTYLRIAAVWDANADAAASIAALSGARVAESLDDLLGDPDIQIVAVCTPASVHAEHIAKAMRAGARAVLCEKPLASTRDDLGVIARAHAETKVPLLVGAMHMHDPAWREVRRHAARLRESATTIRSSIVLPFNDRFENWVTEVEDRPQVNPPADLRNLMRIGILELAIHDIPLIRAFMSGDMLTVSAAALLEPFGYSISATSDGRILDMFSYFTGVWKPDWELEISSETENLHMSFTPSFVHAGSSIATLTSAEGSRVFGPSATNGYENEWLIAHDLARGLDREISPVDDLLADFEFALELADQCCDRIAQERAE